VTPSAKMAEPQGDAMTSTEDTAAAASGGNATSG